MVGLRARARAEGIGGEWLLVLGGIASIVFGYLLLVRPGTGALALPWVIGLYAVVFGIILGILAFRMRVFGSPVVRS